VEELLPSLAFAAEVVVVWDPRGEPPRDDAASAWARACSSAARRLRPQRTFALAQCTQDWVLWLDADERLTAGSLPALARAAALPPRRPRSWPVLRETSFLGRPIHWCGWRDEWLPRLFTRRARRFDDAPVHERVELPGAVTHRGRRADRARSPQLPHDRRLRDEDGALRARQRREGRGARAGARACWT
jgi:hypothetical protein